MAKNKPEDPWAGFVDVLSNILMVVIFLVVILGVAIFALSQQITKAAVDSAVQAEREKKSTPVTPPPPPSPNTPVAAKPIEAPPEQASQTAAAPKSEAPKPPENTKPVEAAKPVDVAKVEKPEDKTVAETTVPKPDSTPAEQRGTAGSYDPAQALRARQADDVAGKTNLSVRNVAVKATKEIEVASEEIRREADPSAALVKSAQALFSLKFKSGSYRIDASSSQEICKSLIDDLLQGEAKLEVRSIAKLANESTTDARRVAYYRGMQTRAELVKCGIPEARIAMKLREANAAEDTDQVQVFVKP